MALDSTTQVPLYGINVWDVDTQESYVTFGKSEAIRTIWCAWDDRNILINNIGGFGGYNLVNIFYYSTAAPYAAAPGLLFAQRVDVQGLGVKNITTYVGGASMVGYDTCAICKIHYGSLPWPPQQPGMLSIDYSADEIILPQTTSVWKFATTGNVVDASQFPSRRNINVALTWKTFNNFSIPSSTFMAYAGAVNSDTFLGASPGQVLFAGAKTTRQLNTVGVEAWDITYPFIFNEIGWNDIYNPQTGNFEKVVDQNGNPPFPGMTLNNLVPGIGGF